MSELSFFEQAAIAAMQGLIQEGYGYSPDELATRAVEYADALTDRVQKIDRDGDVMNLALGEDSVYNLGLSTRIVNTLIRNGVTTITALNKLSDNDILVMKTSGPNTVTQIRLALKIYNEKSVPNDLGILDARIRRTLSEKLGVESIADLANLSEQDVLCTIGLSDESLKNIKSFLKICQKELKVQ